MRSRPGLIQGGDCARGRGSNEMEIAPEAKGLGDMEIMSEAKGSDVGFILFAAFCPLNLGIPVYGTQQ